MVWCVSRPSVCLQGCDLSIFHTHGVPLGLAVSSFLCSVSCVGVTGGAGIGEEMEQITLVVDVGGSGIIVGGD